MEKERESKLTRGLEDIELKFQAKQKSKYKPNLLGGYNKQQLGEKQGFTSGKIHVQVTKTSFEGWGYEKGILCYDQEVE